MNKIAVIGAGNMGSAIIRGVCHKGIRVTVSEPDRAKLDRLMAESDCIDPAANNVSAVQGADLVIVAVEPAVVPKVMQEIGADLGSNTVVASICAAYTLSQLEAMLPPMANRPLLKVIPNTAAKVGHSMTFIAVSNVSGEDLDEALAVFATLGETAVVEEDKLAAATALCSCGLAFAMRYMRAAVEGAVELGLRPEDALRYEMATLRGACALLEQSGGHPEAEIDRVTTPGGITIRGLNAMEAHGFSAAVIAGLLAAGKK